MEFTESLVDDLQVGVLVTGARSGIVRYVNATACEIVGRRPESVVGRPWRFLLPQSDYDLFAVYERSVLQCWRPGDPGGRPRPFRMRFARPDGEIVHARVVAALTHAFAGLLGDDEPHLVYRLEEVTDREKIAYYLGLVLDNSLVSVGLVDRSGRVVYCTGGRTAEETMDILEAEQRPVFEVFAEYQETLSMLEPAFRGEASSKVVQGYGRYFDFHVVPITDAAGRVRLAAAISTDVTERERAHAGQARLAALAEQALVTLEPVGLWQLATTVLADQLGAAAALYEPTLCEPDVVAPADGLRLSASVGSPLPEAIAGGVLSTVFQTGCATVQPVESPGGWRTLAAPVGRPGT